MKKCFFFLCSLLALLTGCQKDSTHTIKVAATSVPHAEILEFIAPDFEQQGYQLQIITVEDYNTPNRALQDGEVDANFFQHKPFLEAQKSDFGYHLESVAAIHLEPMSLYSHKIKNLHSLNDGSLVGIPNDPTNQARALCLLQEQKLISLKKCDSKTSLLDVEGNPRKLKFIEIDSPLLSRSLDDLDLAAITTNFALQAGLSPKEDALAVEGAQSEFANILVVRKGEENTDKTKLLKELMKSQKVKDFINEKYQGAIVPVF